LFWVPKAAEWLTGDPCARSGLYASYIVKAFAYGQYLISMKYASQGVCARHCGDIVNNNKFFCFLSGAAFLSLTRGGSSTLNMLAGANDNILLEHAVSLCLFQFFTLFFMLKTGVLVADKKAFDVFFLQRKAVDVLLKSQFGKLDKALQLNEKKENFVQRANTYLDTGAARFLASTSAVSLLLTLHQAEIQAALKTILWYRDRPLGLLESQLVKSFTPKTLGILVKIVQLKGWPEADKLLTKLVSRAAEEQAPLINALQKMLDDARELRVNERKKQVRDVEKKNHEEMLEQRKLETRILLEEHKHAREQAMIDAEMESKSSVVAEQGAVVINENHYVAPVVSEAVFSPVDKIPEVIGLVGSLVLQDHFGSVDVPIKQRLRNQKKSQLSCGKVDEPKSDSDDEFALVGKNMSTVVMKRRRV
jgi:hypothetical protein